MTRAQYKKYWIDTFSNLEIDGKKAFNTVVVGDYETVIERATRDFIYPLLFVHFPPTKKKILHADIEKIQWKHAILCLTTRGDDDVQFDETEKMMELVFRKLEEDKSIIEFLQVDDAGELIPKEHYSPDDDIGWYCEITVKTFI